MAGSFPHVSNGYAEPKMNRRRFIPASTAAVIGLAPTPFSLPTPRKRNVWTPRRNPSGPTRREVSISMQFETGAQPDRGAGSPFPPIDPRYPDLPVQKWYEYGSKEGIFRLLALWDRTGIKVTSHT